METVKLFSEAVEEVEYITEAADSGKKNYKIKGVFLQADIKNRNGRIYPMEVLEKEVAKYNRNFIREKRAFGEGDCRQAPYGVPLAGQRHDPIVQSP